MARLRVCIGLLVCGRVAVTCSILGEGLDNGFDFPVLNKRYPTSINVITKRAIKEVTRILFSI